jgi:hypothetical protein
MIRFPLALIALLALALSASALASPAPIVQTPAATGVDPTSQLHRNEVAVAWTLGANEYACAVTYSSPAAERTLPLAPTQTSSTETLATVPGQTITVVLSYVSVSPATQPGDACFQPRQSATSTTTAQAYQPPPPPAASPPAVEPEPVAASPVVAPVVVAPVVEERLVALETAVAALAKRVGNLESAVIAAWDAYRAALLDGAAPDVAALAARSAGMNALYGLG